MNPLYQILFSIGYTCKILIAGIFAAYVAICVASLLWGGGV